MGGLEKGSTEAIFFGTPMMGVLLVLLCLVELLKLLSRTLYADPRW